jgi:hypothetical protein
VEHASGGINGVGSVNQATTSEDTADCGNLVHAIANYRVRELAVEL